MRSSIHGSGLLVLLSILAGILAFSPWWPAAVESEREPAPALTTLHADRFHPGNLPIEPCFRYEIRFGFVSCDPETGECTVVGDSEFPPQAPEGVTFHLPTYIARVPCRPWPGCALPFTPMDDPRNPYPDSGSASIGTPSAIPHLPRNATPAAYDEDPGEQAQLKLPFPDAERIDSPYVRATDGELLLQETDLMLPGVGLSFELTRIYNSKTAGFVGYLGAGWDLTADRYLKVTGWGGLGDTPDSFQTTTGGGGLSPVWLPLVTDPTWLAQGGTRTMFHYREEGNVAYLDHHQEDGSVHVFENQGGGNHFFLARVEDLSGNQIQYFWEDAGVASFRRLDYVIDTVGRIVSFEYDDTIGYLEAVAVLDANAQPLARVDYTVEAIALGSPVGVLTAVQGLEVATESAAGGSVVMARPTRTYAYRASAVNGYGLLDRVESARGEVLCQWTYDSGPNVEWRVIQQTDGDATQGRVHSYSWPGNGTVLYESPEGLKRLFGLDASGERILWRIDGYDPNQPNQPATTWSYSTGGTCCQRLDRITFPDGRAQEFQYDKDENLEYLWWVSSDLQRYQVEHFTWSSFDPRNGLANPADRSLTLTQHELLRDAIPGEDPENHCDTDDTAVPGLVRHSYTWDLKGRLTAADYDEFLWDVDPAQQSFLRTTTWEYHDENGGAGTDQVHFRRDSQGGVLVHEVEYRLDATGQFVDELVARDPVNGASWTWSWLLDPWGRVVEETDPEGAVTKWEIDQAGNTYRLQEGWDAGAGTAAREAQLYYDLGGLLAKSVVSAPGATETTVYVRDDLGRVTSGAVTGSDAVTRTSTRGYDRDGNLAWVRDWRGFLVALDYVNLSHRQLGAIRQEYNGVTRTIWQAGDGVDLGYDALGRPTSSRNVMGWKSYQGYDSHGRLKHRFTQVDDSQYQRQTYLYDARGFVKEIEHGAIAGTPANPSQAVWFLHQVLTRNREGHVLAERVYEDGATEPSRATTYELDWRGLPTRVGIFHGDRAAGVGSASEAVSTYKWDARGRLLEGKQYLNEGTGTQIQVVNTTYNDLLRQVTAIVQEAGGFQQKVIRSYDMLGRLSSAEQWEWTGGGWSTSRTSTWEWDGLDRLLAFEDPLGHRKEQDLDGLGRPSQIRRVPNDSSSPQVISYQWNATDGTLSSVTDPAGAVTSFTYFADDFLRPKKVLQPDGRYDEVLAYDALGRVTRLRDSRLVERTLSYDYGQLVADEADLAGQQEVVGPTKLEWIYQPLSKILDVSKVWSGTSLVWQTDYSITPLGELLSESQGVAGAANAWSWSYGFAGEVHDIVYPAGLGISDATWSYDQAGRLDVLSYQAGAAPVGTFQLGYSGPRLSSVTEAISGVQETLGYDGFGRLDSMVYKSSGGATLDGQERTFDLADRVIARKRAFESVGEVVEHDGFGRMSKWFGGVPNPLSHTPGSDPQTWTSKEEYSLDDVFARTQVVYQDQGGPASTESYTPYADGSHFYQSVSGGPQGPVAWTKFHGLLQSDGTHHYFYDAWRRLVAVEEIATGATVRAHTYDAEGRRVRTLEDDGAVARRLVYWGQSLAAEYEESAQGPREVRTYGYVGHGDAEDLVRVTNSSTGDGTWIQAMDTQGSFLALIDQSTSQVAERYRYSSFGAPSVEDASGTPLPASALGNRRFYLGRVWDAELGLYDLRARWYSPGLGCFLSPDPLGPVDSWNLYQYGLGSPSTLADPWGLQASYANCTQCHNLPGDYGRLYGPFSPPSGVEDLQGSVKEQGRRLETATMNLVISDMTFGLINPPLPPMTPYELEAVQGMAFVVDVQMALGSAALSAWGTAGGVAGLLEMDAAATRSGVAAGEVLMGCAETAEGGWVVIGRTKGLKNLGTGERSLLGRLPNQGSPKANWKQNSGVLREEMRRGWPIRDASPGDTGGQFLNAERALLRDRGWTFDPVGNYWTPPGS